MKLTGSNNNNGSQILRMQAHPGNRGGQVDSGEWGGQQMMCVHKNRALFNFKWPQAGKSFS